MGAEQLSPALVGYQVVHLRRPLRRMPSFTSLAFISSQSLATPVTAEPQVPDLLPSFPALRPSSEELPQGTRPRVTVCLPVWPQRRCISVQSLPWDRFKNHSLGHPVALYPPEAFLQPRSSTSGVPETHLISSQCGAGPWRVGLHEGGTTNSPGTRRDTLNLPGREKAQQTGSVWCHFDPAVKQRLSGW